jgi:hypothetical protein
MSCEIQVGCNDDTAGQSGREEAWKKTWTRALVVVVDGRAVEMVCNHSGTVPTASGDCGNSVPYLTRLPFS